MAHAFALPNPALRIIILIIMIASANAALTWPAPLASTGAVIRANANATQSPHPQPSQTLNTLSTAIPVSGTAWKPEPRPTFAQPSIQRLRLTSTAPSTVLAEFCTPTVRRATTSTRLEAAATAHPRNVDPTNTGTQAISPKPSTQTDADAVARPRYAL